MTDQAPGQLRIAVIGPSRFGIGEPFAGGLEAHTAGLVRSLHARGHHVEVFAGPEGAEHRLPVVVHPIVERRFDHEFTGRRDTSHPAGFCRHESDRYAQIAERLARRSDIDLVHNNSMHPQVVDADPGDGSFVHVLHCPPFAQLAAAHHRLAARAPDRRVIAVSSALDALWGGLATDVVHNGVDTDTWFPGTAPRSGAVWAGRIVEEKAPHLAIRAARLAGLPITLAGPIGDERYFARYVERLLRHDDVVWRGPLPVDDLAELFRTSSVGVVSPMWDEPFCLVAAEMLACGTPVASFARGGLSEFIRSDIGSLATAGDVASLAAAMRTASLLNHAACARHAVRELSASTMVDRYHDVYRAATPRSQTLVVAASA